MPGRGRRQPRPAMGDGERVGLRTAELWATLPIDRGVPREVEVVVADVREGVPPVTVLCYRIMRLARVRSHPDPRHYPSRGP